MYDLDSLSGKRTILKQKKEFTALISHKKWPSATRKCRLTVILNEIKQAMSRNTSGKSNLATVILYHSVQ